MTDEQFCLIHTEFTGEKTTSIKQIVLESFSGEELKEYVELHMKYRDALSQSDVSGELPISCVNDFDKPEYCSQRNNHLCQKCKDW